MDCGEVKQLISSAVDDRLGATDRAGFEAHVGLCAACRNEFELERLTKRYVQRILTRTSAPSVLSDRILTELGRESSRGESWISLMWTQPRWRPALAVSLVAAAAVILFVSLPLNPRHLHTSPEDNNIIHQSFNNYDAVVTGALKPQIASSDPDEVRSYFAKHIGYKVRVPRIDKCKLLGALVSEYQGRPLAHLVYQHDGQVVYLYEVDMPTVLEGKTLVLPARAKDELMRTGWFVESQHPNCSLVMWVVDNTLCTAVADIDKNELIAYLSYSKGE